jgi:hypothetical protein
MITRVSFVAALGGVVIMSITIHNEQYNYVLD